MKVLVVDDEPDVIEVVNLCFGLRWPEADVTAAKSGEEALQQLERDPPDLILLDIVLPGMDGFEVCQDVRRISDVPIVMVSARDSEVDKVRGLEMGADDYITKPFSHLELLARVRAVLRRCQNQLPAVGETFDSGDLRVDYASRQVTVRNKLVRLTPTEYSLLFHLTRNAGRVLPHHTLLAKVWGREYTDEIDYLKVYIRRLRQKLEGDPENIGQIISERGVGYKFVAA
ncbi:MAG TPA: response regulator transcription factor [Dehalococcoidia bacterium]|jgi:DNA-binding response OmpR family regulator|nr:response regulator transcription factor [Dehalococcoidia bacterium]